MNHNIYKRLPRQVIIFFLSSSVYQVHEEKNKAAKTDDSKAGADVGNRLQVDGW